MTVLVADVGGTNTRVALAVDPTRAPQAMARFRNDDFVNFDALLVAYCAAHDLPPLAGCGIAIAGPVAGQRARLTNRDWTLDADDLTAALPMQAGARVRLLNDLAALGHALPWLGQGQQEVLRAGSGAGNGQALVVGMGTGVNACQVRATPQGTVVIEAELGHASLPASVADTLRAAIGPGLFGTCEDLFSGRGLALLHERLTGEPGQSGADITAGYATGSAARRTLDLVATLLGRFSRELVFQYLPLDGIHFAGGAARGVLGSPARAAFLAAFEAGQAFPELVGRVPMRLITDDAAALTGAARAGAEGQ